MALAPLPAAGASGLTDTQLRASAVPVSSADGGLATVGAVADAEAASGNGSLVALLKRLRTLLNGGLPAALGAQGALKVEGVASGTAQPVSGTVTANAGSGPFPVSDNAGSLTVDAPVGTPAFVRLSDGAAAITALPVTDNAASITVDAAAASFAVNLGQVAGTTASTGSRVTDAGVQSVFPAAPALANILVGHLAHTATTAAATVITIGSNKTWVGTITVTCDGANTGAATAVGQALGLIATTGANTTPAAATVVSCEARWGANVAAGVTGTQGANSITVPMVINTGAASGTLTLASTIVGTNGRVACTASGYLI